VSEAEVQMSPEELRAAVIAGFLAPPRSSAPNFWVSGVLWAVAALIFFEPVDLVWLALVLLIHEGGHLLAMRAFGYQDTRIFFLPFFGAAASGRPAGEELPWQRAIILLAGPVPGLLLGAGLIVSQVLAGLEPSMFAVMLVAVNLFNLLPVAPLDGGRVVLLLVPSQRLQHVLKLASGLALVGLGVWMESWLLGLFGLWMARNSWTAFAAYREVAPHRDRLAVTATEPRLLTERQVLGLYELAVAGGDVDGTVASGREVLGRMHLAHRALVQPRTARGVERAAIAVAYGVCAVLPLGGAAWLFGLGG